MACHRRPRDSRPPHAGAGRARAARVAAWSITAASAAVAATAVPVLAEPHTPDNEPRPGSRSGPAADAPGTRAEAADEVSRLLAAAERAVERYNGVAERVAELEAEVERRRDRVARGQQAVNEQRRALGSTAAAQYRVGGVSPSLALLLTGDPDAYLERASYLNRAGDRQAGALRELLASQRELTQRRAEAEAALEELTAEKDRLAEARRTAERRLADAESHLAALTAKERENRLRAADPPAPAALGAESAAGGAATAPSARAATAVAAARGVVGRPYGWGQAGPEAFDCSGLVQWAYAQAGVALPRTSQGQAGAGVPVTLDEARPGDIVVYRADASHVGLYVGDGQIVHAPYPGAAVRYDPVGIMSVSSVVRP